MATRESGLRSTPPASCDGPPGTEARHDKDAPICGARSLQQKTTAASRKYLNPNGQAKDTTSALVAIMNKILPKFRRRMGFLAESLFSPELQQNEPLCSYDCCVTNPPIFPKTWTNGFFLRKYGSSGLPGCHSTLQRTTCSITALEVDFDRFYSRFNAVPWNI